MDTGTTGGKQRCKQARGQGGQSWEDQPKRQRVHDSHAPHQPKGGSGGGKGGGGRGKSHDARNTKRMSTTREGTPICYAWNNGGCDQVCAKGFAHVCQICLGNHRAKDHPAGKDRGKGRK